MATGAAVIALASTAASIQQSHKAAKAQERARDVQMAQTDVEAERQKQLQRRQARIKQARIQNLASQTGTSGSSGAIGAVSAIGTQTNANLSFLDQSQQRARATSQALQSASRATSSANIMANIASIATPYADFGVFYGGTETKPKQP